MAYVDPDFMISSANKYSLVVVVLLGVLLAGCTSKRTVQREEQNAYLAGQNAILKQQQAETNGVTVLGPVKNSHVPWVVGLTLAQAIATADYLDSHDPKQIIITRNGESATVDPKVLLQGTDVPLEVGDVIELRP